MGEDGSYTAVVAERDVIDLTADDAGRRRGGGGGGNTWNSMNFMKSQGVSGVPSIP